MGSMGFRAYRVEGFMFRVEGLLIISLSLETSALNPSKPSESVCFTDLQKPYTHGRQSHRKSVFSKGLSISARLTST